MEEELEKTRAQIGVQPVKTWFIQRGDGEIFACQEREAWELLHNRTNWMRNDFKIIGVSDGKTYAEYIRTTKGDPAIVLKEAFRLELEKAKGNIEQPGNHDIITPEGANRDKILKSLR